MIVLRFCHCPTTPDDTRELQDILVTLAAFGMPLKLIFAGAGVQLLDRREGRDTELLSMLPGMGIESVLLEVPDGDRPALTCSDAVLPFEITAPSEVRALMAAARHTVNL